jgi:uncharacterized protein YndB with AHSA1/START domain
MSGYEYTVTRVVDAPVEKVWQVWTEAEHYASLFHAVPGSAELDVRPGGAWKVTMSIPEIGEEPMSGTYVEVVPNKRLVTKMDIPGQDPGPMVMDLKPKGDQTEVTLSQTCATEEEWAQAKEGSEVLLQWCADYLARS